MYSAYETVGVYKRDLLKKRVVAARDEEKGAQQEFKDALTRLKELTGFEGGELEKRYRQLQSNYDDAASRVAAVHKRVRDVETVAGDLFAEWEKENKQIETDSLRQVSRQQLNDTRHRYDEMLSRAEEIRAEHGPGAAQASRLCVGAQAHSQRPSHRRPRRRIRQDPGGCFAVD